eukprot:CAMPEP_0201522698 /NCGR_PEP_ID=MMETSP0161_2-20130828/18500_1 /ASSEMBLY_ACC=CAM_ASM_000251 /TAXON_ID=180227 /ORGANISM="Neoparamoeba aestuarina, Strain SoJaBio B1-5/56/2" /LENGTH=161 /DNA_ID=CAMNT_0047921617 /DNA_START=40 /DNA_END=525 /DNA_ORIENTATION=-
MAAKTKLTASNSKKTQVAKKALKAPKAVSKKVASAKKALPKKAVQKPKAVTKKAAAKPKVVVKKAAAKKAAVKPKATPKKAVAKKTAAKPSKAGKKEATDKVALEDFDVWEAGLYLPDDKKILAKAEKIIDSVKISAKRKDYERKLCEALQKGGVEAILVE